MKRVRLQCRKGYVQYLGDVSASEPDTMHLHVPDPLTARFIRKSQGDKVKRDVGYAVCDIPDRHFGAADRRIVGEGKNEDAFHTRMESI